MPGRVHQSHRADQGHFPVSMPGIWGFAWRSFLETKHCDSTWVFTSTFCRKCDFSNCFLPPWHQQIPSSVISQGCNLRLDFKPRFFLIFREAWRYFGACFSICSLWICLDSLVLPDKAKWYLAVCVCLQNSPEMCHLFPSAWSNNSNGQQLWSPNHTWVEPCCGGHTELWIQCWLSHSICIPVAVVQKEICKCRSVLRGLFNRNSRWKCYLCQVSGLRSGSSMVQWHTSPSLCFCGKGSFAKGEILVVHRQFEEVIINFL